MLITKNFLKKLLIFLIVSTTVFKLSAQQLAYPYPVQYFTISIEGSDHKMAYMDVTSPKPNGEAVLLLHGKNFNGYYWGDVIAALIKEGYRVIVPDQVGWGKSDKPVVHYSFPLLAHGCSMLKLGVKSYAHLFCYFTKKSMSKY